MVPSPLRAVLTAAFAFLPLLAGATTITIQVQDKAGKPVADAVVYAEPEIAVPPAKSKTIQIEQKDRKFIPKVSIIQTGTSISFPNNDTVRHHIYSFSPAKVFEMRLYSGVPKGSEKFDKAGTVILGCNIHDQMIAYIHIVDTPYFSKTDATGKATIDGLGAGKYHLKAWHYNLPSNEAIPDQAIAIKGAESNASFKLSLKVSAFENDSQYQPKQYKY